VYFNFQFYIIHHNDEHGINTQFIILGLTYLFRK
jgi:hypothetical protein